MDASPHGAAQERPPEPRPRLPLGLRRFLLVLASAAFTLLLGEAAVRLYFWQRGVGREDVRDVLLRSQQAGRDLHGGAGLFGLVEPSPFPDIVYQVKPHLAGQWRERNLRTNRHGMRGPEVERAKPPRTYRVVGLGDSHMFGSGVHQQQTYMTLLQQRLDRHAAPGRRFETLNFGAPGYNTVMEVATLEHRALAFAPDLVLMHFIGNDFNPPHFLRPPRSFEPSRWYLVEMLRTLRGREEEGWDEELDDLPTRRERRNAEEYAHMEGLAPYRDAMRRLRRITSERRLPVIVFLLGANTPRRQMVGAVAAEMGLPLLNASPYFDLVLREQGGGRSFREAFVRGDAHPKALGHEAYARALFCELWHLGVPHLPPTRPAECLPAPLTERGDEIRAWSGGAALQGPPP
jgi:hypothetical protein